MSRFSLLVDGKLFRHWTEVEVVRSIDTFSTCSFRAPFDAESFGFRETFRPFTFKPLEVRLDGETFFKGTIVQIAPEQTEDGSSVVVDGYSLPGVLGDCNVPSGALPLEFKGQKFKEILSKICEPFGLATDFRVDTGPVFEEVVLEVDDKPMKLLADLAKQRGLVLTDTTDGAVLVWKSTTDAKPIVHFDTRPSSSRTGRKASVRLVHPRRGYSTSAIRPAYDAQNYFSEITGFVPPKRRKEGPKRTAQNPWLRSRLRPLSIKLDDSEAGDLDTAVSARLGRMFANMMSLEIPEIASLDDPQGDVWAPNTMVEVTAPDVMIYGTTKFLVRDATLRETEDKESAELNLVLPGAFSGQVPARLPWDELSSPDDPLAALDAILR